MGNKYAAIGTAVHQTMEHVGRQKMSGIVMPLDGVHQILHGNLSVIPDSYYDEEDDKIKYHQSAYAQVDWLYERCSSITPLFVEQSFELENMITGLPPCKGTIDRAEGNFAARDVDLIDFKTGKKHTRKDLSNNIQACMYAIAFQKIYGFYPKRFIFLHSKFKCKQEIQITPDFLDAGLSRIKAIWYKIEREEFNPPESSKINKFFCKNFCLYYKGCPRHTRPAGWENVNYTKKII